MRHSKLINYEYGYSYFDGVGEKAPLCQIELDLIDLYANHARKYYAYPELFSLLTERGHTPDNIKSICSFSVLLYADRSGGRWHYKYYLISHFVKQN